MLRLCHVPTRPSCQAQVVSEEEARMGLALWGLSLDEEQCRMWDRLCAKVIGHE